ncbi:MAG: hypothetical protein LBH72_00490 [Proteiniphilum sp.]|jgi:hypothetical protein|nr:hypothetical protein [Proteiniphilum sp.]
MIKKSLLIWLSIIPLAVLNGGIREVVLVALISDYALPISGITLCLMVFLISLIFIPKSGKGTGKTYVKIGLVWLILIVLFETALGWQCGEVEKTSSGNAGAARGGSTRPDERFLY